MSVNIQIWKQDTKNKHTHTQIHFQPSLLIYSHTEAARETSVCP